MASKREKLIRAENNARAAYDKKIKKLTPFGLIAAGVAVLALLLCFCSFIYIYNTAVGVGVEIKVSGWKFLSCFLVGDYDAADSDMQVFYYYAADFMKFASACTFFAIVLAVITAFLSAFSAINAKPALGIAAAGCSFASGVLLIVAFVLCICEPCAAPIIATYCGGNPACSVKSLAVLPAIAAFLACAVSVYQSVRFIKIKKEFAAQEKN